MAATESDGVRPENSSVAMRRSGLYKGSPLPQGKPGKGRRRSARTLEGREGGSSVIRSGALVEEEKRKMMSGRWQLLPFSNQIKKKNAPNCMKKMHLPVNFFYYDTLF